MMELWDAYDREGRPLGVDLVRGEPIPSGMYHRICEVVVRHADGRFLLMRRDPDKDIQPGRWELTAGGSALKGEDALICIRRELFEETGLRCDRFTEVFTLPRDDSGSLFTLFFARTDCDPASVRMQAGETVDYRWIDRAELEDMLDAPDVVTHLRRDFEACVAMGLID